MKTKSNKRRDFGSVEYRSDRLRDDLLVSAGVLAGNLDYGGTIHLPTGVEGECELAMFISKLVDQYLTMNLKTFKMTEFDISFDEFIETALINKYRDEVE